MVHTRAPYSESESHSLRQRFLRIFSPAVAEWREKPNNGRIFRPRLWTAGTRNPAPMFSSRPIFSEALDSFILVQSFEPLSYRHFLLSLWLEVRIPVPRASGTGLKILTI